MNNLIKKIMGDKRQYRRMMARVKALPKDYQFVFQKIQHYMWSYSTGYGMDMVQILEDMVGLFEGGAAEGKSVLDVTGTDVAAFCDELLQHAKTYTAKWRENLNHDIMQELGGRKHE